MDRGNGGGGKPFSKWVHASAACVKKLLYDSNRKNLLTRRELVASHKVSVHALRYTSMSPDRRLQPPLCLQ